MDLVNLNAPQIVLTAAGAGTTNGADQDNPGCSGIDLIVDITAAAAMTLTVTIQGKDPYSGKYYTILASAAFAGVSTNRLRVYPDGLTAVANVSISASLPRTWRVIAVVTGTSVTATISALLTK